MEKRATKLQAAEPTETRKESSNGNGAAKLAPTAAELLTGRDLTGAVERLDAEGMRLLGHVVSLKQEATRRAQIANQAVNEARQAEAEAIGADKLAYEIIRERHGIEGRFTVDPEGKITRYPTAEIVE